jgi:conjugative relaxase-like TrwC/TraI family protein
MLSMAPVGSAGGAANYYASDNYYTLEESAEESIWYGEGAELLGLAPSEGIEGEAATEGESEPPASDATEAQPEPEPEAGELGSDPPSDEIEAGDGAETSGEPDENADDATSSPEDTPEGEEAAPAGLEGALESDEAASADGLPEANGPSNMGAGEGGSPAARSSPPPASPELGAHKGSAEVEFDPERIGGLAETGTATDAKSGTGVAARDQGATTTQQASDEILFDPDRPGGLPEGVTAPAVGPAAATANGAKPGKLPLTNPSGKVDATTFENILNGKLPDGTQVGDPDNRRLGMDLTFSMPKSASILALVGGDKRINEAHMASVKSTMRWVEANLAESRLRSGDSRSPVRTGNLVYALFQHDTSRALDPQGHIHVVIANMTRMADGTWRALHNGEIWRNNTVISSIYHATFRDSLEKLGYGVQLHGKHGTFEISGVPKMVREVFSQRREAILETASKLGIATHQGMNKITATTRGAKIEDVDRQALKAEWKQTAAKLGFNPEQLVEQSRSRAAAQPGMFKRSIGAVEHAKGEARSLIVDVLNKPSDPLVDSGLKRIMLTGPEARTQLATASAIRILSQREAAFEVHQLTKTALDLGLADVTPALIESRVTELALRQELVPGESSRADNVVTMLTTKEALITETGILAEIGRGKGASVPLVRPSRAFEVLSGAARDRPLNAGQMAAASSIISSADRIIAVQGLAGAGKSTMLAAVANVLDFEKKPALGLAFQNKMVADLAEGTGLETMTIASFLMQHEPLLSGNNDAQAATSRAQLGGIHLIVDEASMISNDQMLALVTISNRAGADKLVLVGDRQQLLSIDAGKSFAVSQAGGIATARMDENLRQRTPELRAIAALTNNGRAGEAVKMLGSRVVESADRVGEAAAFWLNLPGEEREATMLFTSGRESRAALNEAIQTGLKSEGKLTGEGLTLTVAERVDRSREELRYAHSYQPGLRLEVWSKVQSVGLERGEYRVSRVFGNGKVELERGGKRQSFDPQKLASGVKQDKLNLVATKEIKIHEGDKIRWTANDKPRDLLNSAMARVVGIDGHGIIVERADQSVVRLGMDDPMLKRIDLAYTLNMHMAQGITTDKGVVVMGAFERFLSNQRLFNVAVTRVRDDLRVITDDKEKLTRQLGRTTGDKYSALEEAGRLDVDKHRAAARAPDAPFNPGTIDGLDLPRDSIQPCVERAPAPRPDTQKPTPQLSVPEKVKGLEL